jgi:hypothetical protein
MTNITVELSLVIAKHRLRALADVILGWADGELAIRRCAVFEKTGEPPWATLPRLPIEKQGKRSYVPLIDLPRDLKQRVPGSRRQLWRAGHLWAQKAPPGGKHG